MPTYENTVYCITGMHVSSDGKYSGTTTSEIGILQIGKDDKLPEEQVIESMLIGRLTLQIVRDLDAAKIMAAFLEEIRKGIAYTTEQIQVIAANTGAVPFMPKATLNFLPEIKTITASMFLYNFLWKEVTKTN